MNIENKFVFIISNDENWIRNTREIVSAIGYAIESFNSMDEFLAVAKEFKGVGCACIDLRTDQLNCASMNSRMIEADVALPTIVVVGETELDIAKKETIGLSFGIISKTISPTGFRGALDAAFARQKLVKHQVSVQRNYRRLTNLTDRERSIVDLVVDGAPNKRIATHLGLSIKTIERVRQSAYRKLDVRSTAEMTKVVILGDLHDIVSIETPMAETSQDQSAPGTPIAPVVPPPMGLTRNIFITG